MLCVLKKNTFITKSQLSARLSPLQTIRPTLPHMATKGLVHSMSTPEVHCSLIGSNEGKNIITYYVDFQSNRLPPSHPLRKEQSTLNTLKNRLKISVHKSVYTMWQWNLSWLVTLTQSISWLLSCLVPHVSTSWMTKSMQTNHQDHPARSPPLPITSNKYFPCWKELLLTSAG